MKPTYTLIERINSTQNIRELAEDDLELLAAELRSFLLHSVSLFDGWSVVIQIFDGYIRKTKHNEQDQYQFSKHMPTVNHALRR